MAYQQVKVQIDSTTGFYYGTNLALSLAKSPLSLPLMSASLYLGPLGKHQREPYHLSPQSDREGPRSSPFVAQEGETAHRPVALLAKSPPRAKVELSTKEVYAGCFSYATRPASVP